MSPKMSPGQSSTLLRRKRGEGTLLLPMTMNGDDIIRSKSIPRLGRLRKMYSPALVKCIMLAFGLLVLLILHQYVELIPLRLRLMIPPHLRLKMRMYLHKDWQQWRRRTFKSKFDCSRHLRIGTKSVPTLAYWQTLRDVYNSVVDSSFAFDDPVPPTQGYTLNENGAPPYYAKLSPGKGRSLFASRDIMKGELVDGVVGGSKSDMKFATKDLIRRYVLALPEPMACDVLEWTYTAELGEGGQPVITVPGNIASLMNSHWDEDANVMPKEGASSARLYATRDIKEGEEILMDYGVFPPGIW